MEEIADAKNGFNLNLPRYIDSSESEDLQDIDAHLNGGIPDRDIDALESYWQEFPNLRAVLFEPANRPSYCQLMVAIHEIKPTILDHPEFSQFKQKVHQRFDSWKHANMERLTSIAIGQKPKELIAELSESLLASFIGTPLLDQYDVYQHLMTYWVETMQDDVYMLASEGWKGAAKLREIIESKDKKTKETPDFTIAKKKFKADFIPLTFPL